MNYISQVIRSQRVKKSLTLINITGLSVCIAAALLIMLYVWSELSYDSFHDTDRVYRVESRLYEGEMLTDNWATTAYGHAPAMNREIAGIEKYVRVTAQDREQVVNYFDRRFAEEHYCYTEPAFFEIFNFPIVKGEKTGQLVRPNTVVLTESAASRYFGEEDPIGKILTFSTSSSQQNFEVTGVIADMPVRSHLRYDFLLSYNTIPKERQDIWYIHGVYTYVRLMPGKTQGEIEQAFRDISDKYKTDALKHKTWAVELIPLKDIHLTPQKAYEKEVKGSRTAVLILFVMSAILLLIGWANALNLTVARFLERGREFGLRKAFGASRRQIIIQGLLESGFMNLLATLIAFGWLELLLPLVYRWAGQSFGTDILMQPAFWGIVAGVVIIGTLVVGLYPSWLMVTIRPSEIMRGKLLHGKRGNRIRKALIVVQFLASFVLIAGTFTVFQQVRYMQREAESDLNTRILVIKYPSFTEGLSLRMESFTKRLKQRADVSHVTVSGAVPGVEVANYFTNRPYGSDPSQVKLIQMFSVDYDYLSAYMPRMVCGRSFSEDYGGDLNRVVLNEEAVRLLGYESAEAALGQQLKMEVVSDPLEIIGVVENYHQQSLAVAYKPIIFFLKERVPFIATPYISVCLKGKGDAGVLTEIEQMYREYFPTSLFSYFFLNDFNEFLYKSDRNFGWIFASASLLAVFVACLGLWIVTLFSTLSRLKEVGIRKVLGANKTSLFFVLTKELLLLTVLASAIGIPVSAVLMNAWLETYAFHISLSWWIYAATFVLLMLIAFLTVFQQVWRTIRQKPMRILKYE
ncbi:ABC transporter permease [Bacteroides fragilis]|uniref:ABC transporter permease n=1 Tax=Bacteroides TaxID=816 RepID=UPI00189C2742|nr:MULTISPECIES: ABC transporter permease [Bacteroides]MCE8623490.1 ABC transporter permease [Bacteroides fragilis]MCE8700416.1 ABC transporter permease [Bacteroides fragilis]MCE8706766.1 ABC transporter permease [Bacteroides fragilis]MCE9324371.1 ABC transporter permease [Bacteroides fragilis]MCE9445980.1 ABC transporter permease [Bacteroides fragilis]